MEYEGLGLEDQALVDVFMLFPQLESARLVEFRAKPEALFEYMGKLLLSFFCLLLFTAAYFGVFYFRLSDAQFDDGGSYKASGREKCIAALRGDC